MKTVLITGATGLVGQEIVKQCHLQNWNVHYLTTQKSKLKEQPNYKGFYWNPEKGDIDIEAFRDVDTVINLAGQPIAERWTKAYKKKIVRSRTDALRTLYNAINKHNLKINHLISASAIGYYPDSLTHYYEEGFEPKEDSFIINVVKQWEASADLFKNLNTTVTKVRIGIVLSEKGGALPKLVKPIKNLIGAPLGSGKQWQSWIHIEDLARVFVFVLENKLDGVYNGVAPNPVTQETFTKLIAKTISKPLILPRVPSFILKLTLGEMSALVLEGQRVSAKKIEQKGFFFKYNQLDHALADLL